MNHASSHAQATRHNPRGQSTCPLARFDGIQHAHKGCGGAGDEGRAWPYVMKNWLPLVSGPLLAIDTTPRPECFSWPGTNSTASHGAFSERHSHRPWWFPPPKSPLPRSQTGIWTAHFLEQAGPKCRQAMTVNTVGAVAWSSAKCVPQMLVPPFPVPVGLGHSSRHVLHEVHAIFQFIYS